MAETKRSSGEIQQNLDRTRAELASSVDSLRLAVERKTDWRRVIQENRGTVIVGAVATGFLIGGGLAALGGLLRRRRSH